MIESLLIANRGEIAIRIMRTAREMGIHTVAVYSDADRHALHTGYADEARYLGSTPAVDSYLNIDALLSVAAGVDAVHPGYGFLSENAAFAREVRSAGHLWIGPPPEAIEMMGDKIDARRTAEAAAARPVPGTVEPLAGPAEVHAFAAEHGLPLVIKASGGGGGRGMRVVRSAAEIDSAFESAAREAGAAFANTELYVERFLVEPRHIEAQIAVDNYGNGVFYGERDCSTQRRNQKLIEEAPASGLPVGVREVIAERSLAIAAECGYRSVGTVEFLVSGSDVFFLEMNTRLQVEHPVTELVTGIDLVAEQLRIAAGAEIEPGHRPMRGHAIEFRINAEDPGDDFRPTPGVIGTYVEPAGPGVRVDSGVGAGSVVSDAYDNLIAKLIVYGSDRESAIRRARRTLSEYVIEGIPTTLGAHRSMVEEPAFLEARVHTQLVEAEFEFASQEAAHSANPKHFDHRSLSVELDGKLHAVEVWIPTDHPDSRHAPSMPEIGAGGSSGGGIVTAPMQGTIVTIEVAAGDQVAPGDVMCVLEAMKMENEVVSPVAGTVSRVDVAAGEAVNPGTVLVEIDPA